MLNIVAQNNKFNSNPLSSACNNEYNVIHENNVDCLL